MVGSTTWGETVLMCGVNQIREASNIWDELQKLQYTSSQALRGWGTTPLSVQRQKAKTEYDQLDRAWKSRNKRSRRYMNWTWGDVEQRRENGERNMTGSRMPCKRAHC